MPHQIYEQRWLRRLVVVLHLNASKSTGMALTRGFLPSLKENWIKVEAFVDTIRLGREESLLKEQHTRTFKKSI